MRPRQISASAASIDPAAILSSSLRSFLFTSIAVQSLDRTSYNICCFFAARDLRTAGFRVLMIEDASAGIDIPGANLFQAAAKRDLGLR